MQKAVLVLCAFGLFQTACGGDDETADFGTISGTASGVGLSIRDAIYALRTDRHGYKTLEVELSDAGGLCDHYANRTKPGSSTNLRTQIFKIVAVDGDESPTTGNYVTTEEDTPTQIGSYNASNFFQRDGACNITTDVYASAGSIEVKGLETTSNGTLSLTLDLTFGTSANHLTGQVTAKNCPGFATALNAGGSRTCR